MVTVSSESPPKAKIAALDAGSSTVSSQNVALIATTLDRLERKCTQPRGLIGDIAAKSSQLLRDKSVQMPVANVLLAIDASIPEGIELDCTEVAAAFVTLTTR